QMADAAQIAQPFFADVGDEEDRPFGFDLRLVQGASDGEDDGQAATIISDAGARKDLTVAFNLHVRAFGKYSVEVSRQDERRPAGRARAFADDIARAVNADIFQSEFGEALFEMLGAFLFLKRRRGDFAGSDLVVDSVRFAGLQIFERADDLRR